MAPAQPRYPHSELVSVRTSCRDSSAKDIYILTQRRTNLAVNWMTVRIKIKDNEQQDAPLTQQFPTKYKKESIGQVTLAKPDLLFN